MGLPACRKMLSWLPMGIAAGSSALAAGNEALAGAYEAPAAGDKASAAAVVACPPPPQPSKRLITASALATLENSHIRININQLNVNKLSSKNDSQTPPDKAMQIAMEPADEMKGVLRRI